MTASSPLATQSIPPTRSARRRAPTSEAIPSVSAHDTTDEGQTAASGATSRAAHGVRKQVSRRHALAIDAICALIHRHPEDDHAVPVLADIARLSVGRFARVFKQHVGLPPHRYVSQVRVHHARALLSSGATPLQAALASGFYDQSHLSRSMRALDGVRAAPHPEPTSRHDRDASAAGAPFCSRLVLADSLAVHFHSLESLS